jgi:hypothetical protein
MRQNQVPRFCDRCSKQLQPGKGEFFVVRIEAIADPTPPAFTEADLARDVGKELDVLIQSMASMTAQEAIDQVYRRLNLYLCNSCFNEWIENPT